MIFVDICVTIATETIVRTPLMMRTIVSRLEDSSFGLLGNEVEENLLTPFAAVPTQTHIIVGMNNPTVEAVMKSQSLTEVRERR